MLAEPATLRVDPEEVSAHAATVSGLAARAELCAQAVAHVWLGAAAYGQLCAFVPALLNPLTLRVVSGAVSARDGLTDLATALRAVAESYGDADGAAAEWFGSVAGAGPDGGELGFPGLPHRSGTTPTGLSPVNPLVAPRVDSATAYSGITLLECADALLAALRSGNWIDQGLVAASTAIEAVAWGIDPIGMLAAAGLGWLIEHVRPLSEALDQLAGDPDQVNANARTWNAAAVEHLALTEAYRAALRSQLPTWTGAAADAYRQRAGETIDLLTALGRSYEIFAVIVSGSGALVLLVRTLVRDLIAQCVATLIARAPLWAAEEYLTLGLGTPHVVAQANAVVAHFAALVARLLRGLVTTLRRIAPLVRQLDEIVTTIAALLRRLRAGRSARPTHPHIHRGALGREFRAGVFDPDGRFLPREVPAAQYFGDNGVHVTPIQPVGNVDGLKSPDAVFRRSPHDPGTITELKALDSSSTTAVQQNIIEAGHQVAPYGGGDAVIDGRAVGLTEETARAGYARAVGQASVHGQTMPNCTHIILGDGRLITLPDW